MIDMESNVQPPNNQQIEANQLSNQGQSQNMAKPGNSSEEFDKGPSEELQLIEQRNELRKLAADLLQENICLSQERNLLEKDFIKSETNSKEIVEAIRERVSNLHILCNKRRKVYESFFNFALRKSRELLFVDNQSALLLDQKLEAIQEMFPTFEEQWKTIETMMTANYENLCGDDFGCLAIAMEECNRIEEICYELTSIILE